MDDEDLSPPTMRSPISTLRVRDHVVAVEVKQPRSPRIRPKLRSGLFPITRVSNPDVADSNDIPTRRLGAA